VRGIGEVVEPLAPHRRTDEPLAFTLVVPPFGVSTPQVYHAWDALAPAERRGDINDLEAAALVVEPRLAHWRDRIREAAGVAPTLAGSGATWFVHGHHDIAEALSDATVLQTTSR